MGIKKTKPRKEDLRDLVIKFTASTGKLSVLIKKAAFFSKTEKFVINGDDQDVVIDAEGKGELEFDKSSPPTLYVVKIKTKGSLTDDQRFAFVY